MAVRDVVVVGASAGGVEALQRFVAALPAELPATVLVVLHLPAHGASALPSILSRSGPLPAVHATDGDPLTPGRIYIAPPDRHLLVDADRLAVVRGPRENGHRPAIDATFRSAAYTLGNRVVAVVLSGTLDDGTAGALSVKSRGGLTFIQDPEDALYAGMPSHALTAVTPDGVAPAPELAELVARHAGQPVEAPPPPPSLTMRHEAAIAGLDPEAVNKLSRPGLASGLTCPDCHGALFEVDEAGLRRYRCWSGHAWGATSLLAEGDATLEHALWMALRALEEKATLSHRLAMSARRRGNERAGERYDDMVEQAFKATATLRALLLEQPAEAPLDGV